MLTKILVALHETLRIKNTDTFFDAATTVILLSANILDIVIVLLMSLYVGKFFTVLYAVTMAVLIRADMGEHYNTWLECLVSGLLIYTLYAFTSLLIDNIIVDLALGMALAVFMVDLKSEKAQKILKRGRP